MRIPILSSKFRYRGALQNYKLFDMMIRRYEREINGENDFSKRLDWESAKYRRLHIEEIIEQHIPCVLKRVKKEVRLLGRMGKVSKVVHGSRRGDLFYRAKRLLAEHNEIYRSDGERVAA